MLTADERNGILAAVEKLKALGTDSLGLLIGVMRVACLITEPRLIRHILDHLACRASAGRAQPPRAAVVARG
jgi:hypothetical protein